MMEYVELIPLAVVATIASMVLGGLWYGVLFSKEWVFYNKQAKSVSRSMYVYGFLTTLVTAYIIALIFSGIGSVLGGLITVLLLWLGFTAMPMLSSVVWEKQPIGLFTINVAYELLSFALMTALVVWLI